MDSTFGGRLSAERKRLGMSQEVLAAKVEATKRSVIDWESDASSPKAIYLMKMVSFGIDVTYLLTGKGTPLQQEVLSSRERALVGNYRLADSAGQKSIERVAMLEAQQADTEKRKAADGSVSIAGDVYGQAGQTITNEKPVYIGVKPRSK